METTSKHAAPKAYELWKILDAHLHDEYHQYVLNFSLNNMPYKVRLNEFNETNPIARKLEQRIDELDNTILIYRENDPSKYKRYRFGHSNETESWEIS